MAMTPSRRNVLTGAAATAALAALPAAGGWATATAAGRKTAATTAYNWKNAAIGGTGFVTGILFHPAQQGLAYARTDIGGAYRWDSATAQWIPLLDFVAQNDWNLLGVAAMAIDPANVNTLYLATGTYAQSWSGNGAVYRSTDKGATFTRTDLSVQLAANEDGRGMGEKLLVDPRSSSTLWLGTPHAGLWTSTDSGATWAKATAFPPTPSASGYGVTCLAAAGRTVFAGWADNGTAGPALYMTTDGATWSAVAGQPTGSSAQVPQRMAYDAATGYLYVTYANGPGPNNQSDGSVWKLNVSTGAWTNITPVVPGSGDTFGYGGVAVDALAAGTVAVTTNNRWGPVDTVFRSTDGGATWTSLKDSAVLDVSSTPFLNFGSTAKFGWWMQTLAIDPFNSSHILYGTGATIYGTTDLVHWAPQIKGLEETSVRFLLSPPSGTAHLVSGVADVGGFYHTSLTASPSAGMSSNPILSTTTGLAQAALNASYVVRTGWSSSQNGGYSTDGGQTWTPFGSSPSGASGNPGPVAVNASGTVLLWSVTSGPLYRSTDNGTTWTQVATAPTGAAPVADPADATRFYAYDTTAGTVYVSTDSGATFTAAATGLPSGNSAYALHPAPGRTGDLWLIAQGSGLYRSTNGGTSFTKSTSATAATGLGFGVGATGSTYPAIYQSGTVGGVTGIFRSDDTGATWTRINDTAHQWGFTGDPITGDPRLYGRVYIGTNGRGIVYGDPA